jgi:hypothetical protein
MCLYTVRPPEMYGRMRELQSPPFVFVFSSLLFLTDKVQESIFRFLEKDPEIHSSGGYQL